MESSRGRPQLSRVAASPYRVLGKLGKGALPQCSPRAPLAQQLAALPCSLHHSQGRVRSAEWMEDDRSPREHLALPQPLATSPWTHNLPPIDLWTKAGQVMRCEHADPGREAGVQSQACEQ